MIHLLNSSSTYVISLRRIELLYFYYFLDENLSWPLININTTLLSVPPRSNASQLICNINIFYPDAFSDNFLLINFFLVRSQRRYINSQESVYP